jgi:hypothetical protein
MKSMSKIDCGPEPAIVFPMLMATEVVPVIMEAVFVLSLVTIAIVMRMQKLTPTQFFWLVAIMLSVFFVVAMMFYLNYA